MGWRLQAGHIIFDMRENSRCEGGPLLPGYVSKGGVCAPYKTPEGKFEVQELQ